MVNRYLTLLVHKDVKKEERRKKKEEEVYSKDVGQLDILINPIAQRTAYTEEHI